MAMDTWHIRGCEKEQVSALVNAGFTPLVATVLAARGLGDPDDAREFLRSDLGLLNDPMKMTDMDKAVERVRRAIRLGEHVAVFGDYDVDGLTSSCLITDYLRSRGLTCDVYIPERLTEGYGLSDDALRRIAEAGTQLVVTVDCGVTAVEQVKTGSALGLEFVITDHHKCGELLPEACAVVDPLRPDCPYPFKGLAGVGVAFKLVCAIEGADKLEDVVDRYCELVAFGTIADIMPVTGENRTLIRRGIHPYRTGSGGRVGILALMAETGIDPLRVTDLDVSFSLIPKLNAAGRMGCVHTAFDLLMTNDRKAAADIAVRLCELNHQRREVENRIFTDALSRLPESVTEPIVLADEHWHHGVSGIVASRLAERFGVPAIIICIEDGEGRGSCRSCPGFSIYDALCSLSDMLISYGGHALAAGVTMPQDSIDDFRAALTDYYHQHAGEAKPPELSMDAALEDLSILSMKNIDDLSITAPWGNGNPPPRFCAMDVVVDQIQSIGGDRHVKMRISKSKMNLECIFFSKRASELDLRSGSLACLSFEANVNEFRGNRSVQLLLRDAVPSETFESEGYGICTRFMGGGDMDPEELRRMRPSRDELAAVWRTLSRHRPGMYGNRVDVLNDIIAESGMRDPCRTYICLLIFRELGLIAIDCDSRTRFDLSVMKIQGKANLADSGILRRLTPEESEFDG